MKIKSSRRRETTGFIVRINKKINGENTSLWLDEDEKGLLYTNCPKHAKVFKSGEIELVEVKND